MRVALVHDWLTGMRGGERCLEVFCELCPDATLFTLIHVPGSVSERIEHMQIRASALSRLPGVSHRYRMLLPLFPWVIERFDLAGYDLILSSSHCVAKGVRVPPGALQISCIFTPMQPDVPMDRICMIGFWEFGLAGAAPVPEPSDNGFPQQA
jgi:hypothetical protein